MNASNLVGNSSGLQDAFKMDWSLAADVLILIIVLSFLVERALSLIFENRFYVERFTERGFKEIIAFIVSFVVVVNWEFDALSAMLQQPDTTRIGYIITAAVIAGGSKASIKLFHDILGMKSGALKEKEQALKNDNTQPSTPPASNT